MRLHKTGHVIADTVSDLIGELPDGDYDIAYGILRHNVFEKADAWFEIDKGMWNAGHYDGFYRLSFQGTQPRYNPLFKATEPHGLTLQPFRSFAGMNLICPPTAHVCDFFGIDYAAWLTNALMSCKGPYLVRHKGDPSAISWDEISRLITFNSTLGAEALRRGIQVTSDPSHSTIGSYFAFSPANCFDAENREELFCFIAAHQFLLSNKDKICKLIKYYLSTN